MNYRIIWLEDAEKAIAQIWNNADRTAQLRMSDQLYEFRDAVLADPEMVGESRDGGRRVAFFQPLMFQFEIDRDRGIIWIQDVRAHRAN